MKDYSLKINGNQYDISIEDVNEESTMANVTVNGVAYEVEIVGEQASKMKKGDGRVLSYGGQAAAAAAKWGRPLQAVVITRAGLL